MLKTLDMVMQIKWRSRTQKTCCQLRTNACSNTDAKRYQNNSLLSLHCAVSNDQNSFSVYVKNTCKLEARQSVSVAHPLIPVAA